MSKFNISKLAVCSWSLHAHDPNHLIQQLHAVEIDRVQIALDPLRTHPAVWGILPDLCAKHSLTLVSGMLVTIGEDYSTMEAIKRTGGVVPDATWDQNWKNIQADAVTAKKLDLDLVTLHAGFLPHETSDPAYDKLHKRIVMIADMFGEHGIKIGFETGQETADTLKIFLQHLNKPNVGVNFDPANMILYDKGDPIAALRVLAPWLLQCHIKDAVKTKVPGTWGEEVAVGTGQVDWRAFMKAIEDIKFNGDFAIEREAGNQRVADIRTAREYLTRLAS